MVVPLSFKVELIEYALLVLCENNFTFVVGQQKLKLAVFWLEVLNAGDLNVLKNAISKLANDAVLLYLEDRQESSDCGEDNELFSHKHSSDLAFVDVIDVFVTAGSFDVKRSD